MSHKSESSRSWFSASSVTPKQRAEGVDDQQQHQDVQDSAMPEVEKYSALLLTKEVHSFETHSKPEINYFAVFRLPSGQLVYLENRNPTHEFKDGFASLSPGQFYNVELDEEQHRVVQIFNEIDNAYSDVASLVYNEFCSRIAELNQSVNAATQPKAVATEVERMNVTLAEIFQLTEEAFSDTPCEVFPVYSIFPRWKELSNEELLVDVEYHIRWSFPDKHIFVKHGTGSGTVMQHHHNRSVQAAHDDVSDSDEDWLHYFRQSSHNADISKLSIK